MKLKQLVLGIASIFTLAACTAQTTTSSSSSSSTQEPTKLTVGINASGQPVWDSVAERLKEHQIELDIRVFEDYIQPNTALENGDVDFNAFQTIIYMERFNKEKGTHIKAAAYTVIAPMGIYSKKISNLSELPDNAKIAVPQDTSNNARALRLLHAAGIIQLDDVSNTLVTVDNIVSNPKNIEIIELPAAQLVTALEDVTVSVINSGVAVEAGLLPTQDAIQLEEVSDASTPYYNVIAVKEGNENNEAIKKVIEVYQTEETKKVIQETTKGASIPVWEKAGSPQ